MKHTSMADVHNLHTVQSYSFQVPQLQTVALKHADLEIKTRSVTHIQSSSSLLSSRLPENHEICSLLFDEILLMMCVDVY